MKPANPENVPLDKIPAGWRLLYEGEYRCAPFVLPCRVWSDPENKGNFSSDIDLRPSYAEYTYITPDLPDNGQPWHAHKPGDPAPVGSKVQVDLVVRNGGIYTGQYTGWSCSDSSRDFDILFYRLHDPATKPNPQTTFEAHGHTWFKHTPGDPMPCDGESLVHWLSAREASGESYYINSRSSARKLPWGEEAKIVGWCYADIELPTPEDPSTQAERTSLPTPAAEPTVKSEDPVNLPTHYRSHPSGVECIEVTEHMNFCLGNAVKYLWRAGLKSSDTHLQDLRKARWYLDREITRIEKQQAKNTQP